MCVLSCVWYGHGRESKVWPHDTDLQTALQQEHLLKYCKDYRIDVESPSPRVLQKENKSFFVAIRDDVSSFRYSS